MDPDLKLLHRAPGPNRTRPYTYSDTPKTRAKSWHKSGNREAEAGESDCVVDHSDSALGIDKVSPPVEMNTSRAADDMKKLKKAQEAEEWAWDDKKREYKYWVWVGGKVNAYKKRKRGEPKKRSLEEYKAMGYA